MFLLDFSQIRNARKPLSRDKRHYLSHVTIATKGSIFSALNTDYLIAIVPDDGSTNRFSPVGGENAVLISYRSYFNPPRAADMPAPAFLSKIVLSASGASYHVL